MCYNVTVLKDGEKQPDTFCTSGLVRPMEPSDLLGASNVLQQPTEGSFSTFKKNNGVCNKYPRFDRHLQR